MTINEEDLEKLNTEMTSYEEAANFIRNYGPELLHYLMTKNKFGVEFINNEFGIYVQGRVEFSGQDRDLYMALVKALVAVSRLKINWPVESDDSKDTPITVDYSSLENKIINHERISDNELMLLAAKYRFQLVVEDSYFSVRDSYNYKIVAYSHSKPELALIRAIEDKIRERENRKIAEEWNDKVSKIVDRYT